MDVLDLVENREGEDLAYTRNRPQPVIALGVVLLGPSFEMEFDVTKQARRSAR